ncbi:Serine/threonine-protein kinase PrkC [Aquisphaera giovannonii]|uniref:Serine/threonine-protein kinase PrkC n=1 Tax=Aquisphaera giovannonii TaxID=406548 RepID=A0A5B9VXA2_9BACT|nr:serine/threonine-protein kinase [Aquisphaera giovannonii]QEH32714.1 Serine/threonine-protein kinase PrkC [Aquisphaera giovannonii]
MVERGDGPHEEGVDPFVDAYEEAQARDGHADIASYLPDPGHPLFAAVLCELVRVDMEYAWTRGRPVPLEDYLARFPSLSDDTTLFRLAAFEECRQRRQAGESPSAEEYGRRFGIADASWLPSAAPRPGDAGTRLAEMSGSWEMSLRAVAPRTAERVAEALSQLPEPGSEFAGFRLVQELGRGAFGRVYLARQGDLADRPVALKVSAELFDEPRALAQLQHTHVVPIYSAHRVGGLRAVCMPYFGATTLADVLSELRSRGTPPDSGAALAETLTRRRIDARASTDGPPAPSARAAAIKALQDESYVQAILRLGAHLADGLAHAHERGIIHRDLKPANVLLTDDGEPMLLDFNLAADVKDPHAAAAALAGGTLPYMAPEALDTLRTGPQPADPRSDIYALGLILYELLTGRHPFPERRGPLEELLPLMAADRRGQPPRLRPWNPAVSRAAESIIARCLEPDVGRRYGEARHLLEDLQRELDDRPLRHAPDPSRRERLGKWARRHPRLSSGTALMAMAAVVIVGIIAGYSQRQRRFRAVEAEQAFRRLADDHEAARILLLDPADDPARREEGLALCRRALGRYEVLDRPDWARSYLITSLPAASQAELKEQVGEVLLLGARALNRQSSGLAPDQRATLSRSALRWNGLAEACYEGDAAPRALWSQRAYLADLAGDHDGAERARRRALATPIRSLREYAMILLGDDGPGAGPEALPALADASRRAPQDFALWMNLGQCQAHRGRLADAEDCFTVAIALRPGSPWGYFHRGRVELERRDHEQARLDLDRAIWLRPDLAAAYVNRALARLGSGDAPGAVADLTTALDRGAVETRIFFMRAQARARAGDRDGARRDRDEGLRRPPADPESWVARGLARLPSDPEAAIRDFDAALALDPRCRPALQNKAAVLSDRLGRTGEAIEVLHRAVSLHPDYVPSRVGRGVLLARLGRREEAHRDAEESRRRDASADTAYRIACIYALTAKADPAGRSRALGMLATALGQAPAWAEIARTDPDLDPIREQAGFADLLRTFAPSSGPAG